MKGPDSLLEDLLNCPRSLIMGILNVTPDSFSDGGLYFDVDGAAERAFQMEAEGADIIDIGGESSRPGAQPVSQEEEERRVLPVIEALIPYLKVPISIDTYKSQIARKALEQGAQIVNDISGLRLDRAMVKVVARFDAHVVIMHMKGMPRTMQVNPHYDDLMAELSEFFRDRIDYARAAGVSNRRIIVDPGIGFGKRLGDNFAILKSLRIIADLGYPVLVGPSRKSFIGLTLDLPEDDRVEGTAAAVTAAILNGAKIVRVHDVKEMKRVITIADAIAAEGAEA